MEKALNTMNVDNTSNQVIKKRSKKKIDNVAELDKLIEPIVAKKQVNIMARRYELAYTKLHNELPIWKKQSFNKNNKNVNDTLYNEFILSVIALAENLDDPILLTA
jgi:hypothetical protein